MHGANDAAACMIGVIGAGAFGTALAIVLAETTPVTLLARSGAADMMADRENRLRLPGARFPEALSVTETPSDLAGSAALLLAVPAQALPDFWASVGGDLPDVPLVLCAKGIVRDGLRRPSELLPQDRSFAVLTGPSFAGEIAAGLPTALTLAGAEAITRDLQSLLSRPRLRLYRTEDVVGAELGGALKNVVAIAAGIAIGAGLGESARAALITRGFAEIRRLARRLGARDETLMGLSGFGDLALTAGSPKSRNFAFGLSIGSGQARPGGTIEGIATAEAVTALAQREAVEMPIAEAVVSVLANEASVEEAMSALLSRPLSGQELA